MRSAQAVPAEAMVDGRREPLAQAALPLTDEGVARGDGAFETVGVWNGRPFRLDDHLQRLTASLRAILLPGPDFEAIRADIAALLEGIDGDAALRVFVTASGTRIVTRGPQPPRDLPRHLVTQPAPWIRPRGTYGPAGAKTMSYGPNMTATRAAKAAGGDEALLVSLEGFVLEGPTFCVAWVSDGVVHTPTIELGLVDSISRRTMLEIAAAEGLDMREARYRREDLAAASEFFLCSSVRPVVAVSAVDDLRFSPATPVRDRFARGLEDRRRAAV